MYVGGIRPPHFLSTPPSTLPSATADRRSQKGATTVESHTTSTCELYFAYGSNLDHDQMADRCPGALPVGTAQLSGWRFAIGEHGVATIVSTPGAVTWGGLWHVTARHLEHLDRYEGVHLPDRYQRHLVEVATSDGPVTAIAYIEPFREDAEPRPSYMDRIIAGAETFGLPTAYITTLKEV